jgi:hypothetical protein
MSITFRLNNTPYRKVTVTEPDGEAWEDTVPEDGWTEINMSQTNAMDLLNLLNRPADAKKQYGTWDLETVAVIMRRLVKLRNMQSTSFEKTTKVEGNFVEIDRDSEYVDRKLNQMNVLLRSALEKQIVVTFS